MIDKFLVFLYFQHKSIFTFIQFWTSVANIHIFTIFIHHVKIIRIFAFGGHSIFTVFFRKFFKNQCLNLIILFCQIDRRDSS